MPNIVLVGSVHVDHKGPERLDALLRHYQPTIICLESTREGLNSGWNGHKDLEKKWTKIPWEKIYSPEKIERARVELTSSYFESWVPVKYKNANPGTRLFCIDMDTQHLLASLNQKARAWAMSALAKGKRIDDIATTLDMTIQEFIEHGSMKEYQEATDKLYDRTSGQEFREIYGDDAFKIAVLDRDAKFASDIRTIHANNPEQTIVAILGASHIFGEYAGSTYNLLADLKPNRIKLKDADTV